MCTEIMRKEGYKILFNTCSDGIFEDLENIEYSIKVNVNTIQIEYTLYSKTI